VKELMQEKSEMADRNVAFGICSAALCKCKLIGYVVMIAILSASSVLFAEERDEGLMLQALEFLSGEDSDNRHIFDGVTGSGSSVFYENGVFYASYALKMFVPYERKIEAEYLAIYTDKWPDQLPPGRFRPGHEAFIEELIEALGEKQTNTRTGVKLTVSTEGDLYSGEEFCAIPLGSDLRQAVYGLYKLAYARRLQGFVHGNFLGTNLTMIRRPGAGIFPKKSELIPTTSEEEP